ncbi:MAG TPA: hypothetical protein PKN24_16580, partial [bacterium]|nr:hypothetical protein [bacterium]
MKTECRYFKIAGITIQYQADIPLSKKTFSPNLASFESGKPEKDMIRIEHHFGLPDFGGQEMGQKVFERQDLTIFRKPSEWIFFSNILTKESKPLQQVAFVNPEYTHIKIFNERDDLFRDGDIPMLSFHQTDQLFITRVLAKRNGIMFHASGVRMDGEGLLFLGHSEAGKSTMIKLLEGKAEILCDDRIIVRQEQKGFRIHGTWHHGEIPTVSPHSAPLKAIFLLEKAS